MNSKKSLIPTVIFIFRTRPPPLLVAGITIAQKLMVESCELRAGGAGRSQYIGNTRGSIHR